MISGRSSQRGRLLSLFRSRCLNAPFHKSVTCNFRALTHPLNVPSKSLNQHSHRGPAWLGQGPTPSWRWGPHYHSSVIQPTSRFLAPTTRRELGEDLGTQQGSRQAWLWPSRGARVGGWIQTQNRQLCPLPGSPNTGTREATDKPNWLLE